VTDIGRELTRAERKVLDAENEAQQRPDRYGKKWRKVLKVKRIVK
jgi:hypothetical protein